MTDITTENIVASVKISSRFDVERLAEKIPGCSYNPDEFAGLTMKFDEPKVAVLVLSDGRIICTGAKNIEEVNETIKKVAKKIKDAGFELKKDYDIQTENFVISTDFKKQMNLKNIAKGLPPQNVDYQPEQFQGLIYRLDDLCAVILLFNSGKLVCTGAKTLENAAKAVDMMKEKLSSLGVL